MLIELFLSPIFLFLETLIGLIPSGLVSEEIDLSKFLKVLEVAFAIFPYDLFMFAMGNIIFWLEVQLLWAVIEWVYKKLPGVN